MQVLLLIVQDSHLLNGDYFMHLEQFKGNYSIKLASGQIQSGKNIFNTCTLVSGTLEGGGMAPAYSTIDRLTDHLIFVTSNFL